MALEGRRNKGRVKEGEKENYGDGSRNEGRMMMNERDGRRNEGEPKEERKK